MTPVGVGIIGYGRIGAEHARWIGQSGAARVAAAADATAARRGMAEGQGFRTYGDIDALLNDAEVEAALVATPTAMHYRHASAAIAAGKHVMIEKPVALNYDEARRLIEESERRGVVLSVFHNRRWDADYLTVRAAVAAGVVGKLINVESRLHQWGSCVGPAAREYRPNWRNEAEFGGGGLYDWGSHFVDQLWRLMWPDRARRVFAQLRGNVWSRECDDFARVVIDFESGAVGMVEINTTTTRPLDRWRLDGTLGSAWSPFSATYDTGEWARLRFRGMGGEERALEIARGGLSEGELWRRFAGAVRGEGEVAVSGRSVLPTMRLLDAAFLSSKEGRAVEIEGEEEDIY